MRLTAPPLIGRDLELSLLRAGLDRARAGHGGSVLVTGEAGIGKSRLTREAAAYAFGAGMRILRGRTSSLGLTVPFRPLTEALLGLSRVSGPPHDPALAGHRAALGRLIPEWRDQFGSADDEEPLLVLAEAVLRLLGWHGREHGCVVILEDLHDADAETLTVVEYLVDNLHQQPVLLIGTARDEAGPARDLMRSAGQRASAAVLSLTPLGAADVRRLVASCLDMPVEDTPRPVTDRIGRDCGGNPFMVEELLSDWISGGALAPYGDGWRLVGGLTTQVPTTLVHSVAERVDRLGVQGRALLCAAATLGHRFPLSVVQEMAGLDERGLFRHLHAAFTAHLVMPDENDPQWYNFRHALTVDALLSTIGPTRRQELAALAAATIERLRPALPGEWCQLAASLHLAAGDAASAGTLLTEAGRRALNAGAAVSAVALLERAHECLPGAGPAGPAGARGEMLETLLLALTEAGQVDRALSFVGTLDAGALDPRRRAVLHTQLASAAAMTGRWSEGMAQVAAARALIGANGLARAGDGAELVSSVDIAEAELTLYAPGADRLRAAEALARRTVAAAEEASLPVVACRAWKLLGTLTRLRSFDESDRCFHRMDAIADKHGLPIWRLHALVRLAGNDALRDGSMDRLFAARAETTRLGAVAIGYTVDSGLAFQYTLCGDFRRAGELIEECVEPVRRLRLTNMVLYTTATRAAIAAHQGRRGDMERDLAEFRSRGGESTPYAAMAAGLCEAICALLEEDRAGAEEALTRAAGYERDNPTIFHLSGRHGLQLLLRALDGDLTLPGYVTAAGTMSAALRWNRQFGLLANAVLLGRAGDAEAARDAVARAGAEAEIFPMARWLGARLVAEAAIADGWADPVPWLRAAEDYFHRSEVPAVASACRSLLRRSGARVTQRRSGHERVPAALRRRGMTIREYEVLELLVDRPGNREIAARLHLSPRTVEKHVANLLAKAGLPDRAALCAYAARAVPRS